MAKILGERNGTVVTRKTKPMKKISKAPKAPKATTQVELGELKQVMMLSQLIGNLEQKCLEHGLEQQLILLRKTFKPSTTTS